MSSESHFCKWSCFHTSFDIVKFPFCSQNTRLLILYVHMYFPYWWFLQQFEFCVIRELLFWKVRSVPILQYFTWKIPIFLTSWSPSLCGLCLETCLSWCCFSLVALYGSSKLQQFLGVFELPEQHKSCICTPFTIRRCRCEMYRTFLCVCSDSLLNQVNICPDSVLHSHFCYLYSQSECECR